MIGNAASTSRLVAHKQTSGDEIMAAVSRLAGRLRSRRPWLFAFDPAFDVALRTRGHGQRAGQDVFADHRAGTGVRAVADGLPGATNIVSEPVRMLVADLRALLVRPS